MDYYQTQCFMALRDIGEVGLRRPFLGIVLLMTSM